MKLQLVLLPIELLTVCLPTGKIEWGVGEGGGYLGLEGKERMNGWNKE